MGTRGRKSAAELEIVPAIQVCERQKAPHDLTDEECEVWSAVVNTEPAERFSRSNIPLLQQFCRHVVQARRIAELIEKATSDTDLAVADWDRLLRMQERESRQIATLATKMCISQRSTVNWRGNKKPDQRRKPWEG